MEFDGDHFNGGRADVAKKVDEVAANFLFRAVVDTDTGVGGITAAIGRDLFALDEYNCLGAFADAGDALR